MPIREDVDIKGPDGETYRFNKGLKNYQNKRTGWPASYDIKYELDSIVIEKRLVVGENIFRELLELSRIHGDKDPEYNQYTRRTMKEFALGVKRAGEKNRGELLEESEFIKKNQVRIGRPCMFYYKAKYAKKLKYYDKFPVIIPIEKGNGWFMGLNVHYLKPEWRAGILDLMYNNILKGHARREALYEKVRLGHLPISAIQSMTDETYFDIDYAKIAVGTKTHKFFRPMIHKYLTTHVESRVIEITPRGWTMCMFLPVAKFTGKSQRGVWEDSDKKIREYKEK